MSTYLIFELMSTKSLDVCTLRTYARFNHEVDPICDKCKCIFSGHALFYSKFSFKVSLKSYNADFIYLSLFVSSIYNPFVQLSSVGLYVFVQV